MAIFALAYWGNPVLEKVSERVRDNEFDTHELYIFSQSLIETMTANNGVGLAAPQVNVSKRLFAMELPDHKGSQPFVLCNPTLTATYKATDQKNEGCLSMPGIYLPVDRSTGVVLQYQEPSGKFVEVELTDMDARVVQHELDHLDGRLFINLVSRQLRREAMRQWE